MDATPREQNGPHNGPYTILKNKEKKKRVPI